MGERDRVEHGIELLAGLLQPAADHLAGLALGETAGDEHPDALLPNQIAKAFRARRWRVSASSASY
jgi:hypothetical protein